MDSKVKYIAHRGLSGLYTENTYDAFLFACLQPYYGVECDIHLTKNKKFVISHDDSTGRLCNVDLKIEDSTLAELQALTFKDGKSKILTLAEYLNILKAYDKVAVIELKKQMVPYYVEKLISVCKENYSLDKIIFISFIYNNLRILRRMLPDQPLQLLMGEYDRTLIKKLAANKIDVDVHYQQVSPALIGLLHDNNLKLNCWTCDDEIAAKQLETFGIDYITSNILV